MIPFLSAHSSPRTTIAFGVNNIHQNICSDCGILASVRPKAFLLENVEGLVTHDNGKTLTKIEVLRSDLNYHVPTPRTLNANDFGLAQQRKRIFIVGFACRSACDVFKYPEPYKSRVTIRKIRQKSVDRKYYISEGYLETLRRHAEREKTRGNGFGYVVLEDDEQSNALVGGGRGASAT